MEVSYNGGIKKWMVYIGKSENWMDKNGGYPHDFGNLQM